MVNEKGLKVFVHSCSGHTRAATVVLIYLALYRKYPDWDNIEKLS
jgi:protein-tyrosine phosphatase